jgi:hypothetical protein
MYPSWRGGFISPVYAKTRRPGESRDPDRAPESWIPAFAGMTGSIGRAEDNFYSILSIKEVNNWQH